MRPIDADELMDDIEDAIDIENDGQDIEKSKLIILGLKIAKKYIKKACTIEAEPAQSVHQGTWLFNTHTEVFPWKCSKCNYDTVARFNYCPSCGTKMGGDNDD